MSHRKKKKEWRGSVEKIIKKMLTYYPHTSFLSPFRNQTQEKKKKLSSDELNIVVWVMTQNITSSRKLWLARSFSRLKS